MHSQQDMKSVAKALLAPQGLVPESCEIMQSLWAGYGHICHITALSSSSRAPRSLILKYISPPQIQPSNGEQERCVEEGHVRKILSYQVEQYFYTRLVPQMPSDIGVAECIASINTSTDIISPMAEDKSTKTTTAMVLTDLRPVFPVAGEKRIELNATQVYASIEWLAKFHGFWWARTGSKDLDRSLLCRPPLQQVEKSRQASSSALVDAEGRDRTGVWLNGGYTYLLTRLGEYQSLKENEDSEWSSKLCEPVTSNGLSIAELAAAFISTKETVDPSAPASQYETLIHGDVKSENLFTTQAGDAVAFFDFQYVGLGLGVCDLAKLLTCSVPRRMLCSEIDGDTVAGMCEGEVDLLQHYVKTLETVANRRYEWNVFVRHWETALVDWLRFQASWGFWGNTDWLESRVRSVLEDDGWLQWMKCELKIE